MFVECHLPDIPLAEQLSGMRPGDIITHSFEQVRERIRRGTGKIRHSGSDYLFYALLDEVVDKYFPILDKVNTRLTGIEEAIMISADGRDNDIIQQIHHAKSDLLLMHRTMWPMTDIISMIMREETPLVTKATGKLVPPMT